MSRRSKTYRKIWEKANGPIPVDEAGRPYEIHHIDGDCTNNSLSNLMCVSIEEHYRIHEQQGDQEACHAIKIRMEGSPLVGWNHSEATRAKISKATKGRKCSAEEIQAKIRARTGYRHSNVTLTKLSNAHKVPVIHNPTGTVYESSLAAAKANGVSQGTICNRIKEGVFSILPVNLQEMDRVFSTAQCFTKRKAGDSQKRSIQHVASGVIYESTTAAAKAHNKHRNNINKLVKSGIFRYV